VTFYETEIMAPLKCPVRGDALAPMLMKLN
jgi:hypothetical protein